MGLGNIAGEYIDNVRAPQDSGCPHNKIWNECGNSCRDSYCCPGVVCDELACTLACEPRCECPEGMVPSPANSDLCILIDEACSDVVTTPTPPTTPLLGFQNTVIQTLILMCTLPQWIGSSLYHLKTFRSILPYRLIHLVHRMLQLQVQHLFLDALQDVLKKVTV